MLEKAAIGLAAALLSALVRTLRYRVEGAERLDGWLASGGRAVLYSWHEVLVPAPGFVARYRPTLMISQSRDGERIAHMVHLLGFSTVRGSSSRGGVRALVAMIRAVRGGAVGCHLVDGPRGPAHEVKPGLIALGQRANAALFPVVVAPRWAVRARSWDRMLIPLPFSRVRILVGEPVHVPEQLSDAEAESLRKRVESDLERDFARVRAEEAA